MGGILFGTPGTQSPKAYDLANLGGAVLAGRIGGAASVVVRGNIRTALQDGAYLYKIHPSETAAGLVDANLTFGFNVGDVRRYGADSTGVADSSAAFANAFKVTGVVTAIGNYKLNASVTLDISTTSLYGPGTITSGLAANAGALINVHASGGPEANSKNRISQLEFVGNGAAGVQCLVMDTPSNSDEVFGIDNCTFYNFAAGVQVTNAGWEIEFHRCAFSSCGSDTAGLYVHYAAAERLSLVQCALYNCIEAIRIDAGGQIFLHNCSIDYCNRAINAVNGKVLLNGCYIESNTDVDNWLKTGNNTSLIRVVGSYIAVTGAKPNFCIGSSASAYGGGIVVTDTQFYAANNTQKYPIVDGAGFAWGRNNMMDGWANVEYAWPFFAAAANECFNGTFSKGAGNLGGWIVGNSGAGGNPTAAANTLTIQTASAGFYQFAKWQVQNCRPGENVGVQFQLKANSAGATFFLQLNACGSDGTILASNAGIVGYNSFNATGMPTVYTLCSGFFPNLPAGTDHVDIVFRGSQAAADIINIQSVYVGRY